MSTSQYIRFPNPNASANPSVGKNGVLAPLFSTEMGAIDPSTGFLASLLVDPASNLLVNLMTSIPAGSNVIGGVTQSGNWDIRNITGTVSLPTGAATEATLSGMSAKLPAALGTQLIAGSMAVNIASDQVVPVTGSFFQATQPVSTTQLPATLGAKTIANAVAVSIASDQTVPVSGTFWQATQPVSAASLPLPTGASTSAKQPALGTAGTASADVITVQGIASMTALKVDGSAVTQPVSGTFWQATQPISGTVTVNALTNASVVKSQLQDNSGNGITSVAQGTLRGLNASDLGYSSANAPVRNDYTVTSVTTGAYVQLVASLTSDCQEIEIFDSSGQTLTLATGAAASEVNQINIFPGGNGRVKLRIASGTRISIKAVSASATVGEIDINFYG